MKRRFQGARMNRNRSADLKVLLLVLNESERLISVIVENPAEYFLEEFSSDQELMRVLEGAWREAQISFTEAKQTIESELTPRNEEQSRLWFDLHRIGLTGVQLELKLLLFKKLEQNFQEEKKPRWLKRLLGHINSIFGSLSSVLPGIEATKELKDAIEKMVSLRKAGIRH
jgi:hypothetical protein